MSKLRRKSGRSSEEAADRPVGNEPNGTQQSRIDPPHEPATPPAPTAAEPAGEPAAAAPADEVQAPSPAEAANERIQVHADQLAARLRGRQRELDHRESQINARLAALDRDMRAARLWLKEREAELAERTEDLDHRQADLEKREAELQRRTRDPDRNGRHGSPSHLHARRKEMDRAERQVQQARAEAEGLREQLREAQRELSEEARQQRRRLVAEQRTALAEIEKQREAVRRRSEHVDQSRATLEQLRAELGRVHRETLEIRLATEELWVQLSGAAPPAALTKSLSGIRSKLADHYRFANAELRQQKQELEAIRRQLGEQCDQLAKQKEHFDRWAQQQRQDAEADASRLAAREAQLHQLEAELNDRARLWQAQRLDYEQQIRRLKAQASERLSGKARIHVPSPSGRGLG